MAKLRRIGAAVGVSLLVGTLVAGPAGAAQSKTLDQLQGSATGSTLTLDLLGRHLTVADSNVTSSVTKSVTTLSDVKAAASTAAILGGKSVVSNLTDADRTLKKSCAADLADTKAVTQTIGAPALTGGVACATSVVNGSAPTDFSGIANGSIATANIAAGQIVSTLIGTLAPVLDQVKDTPVGTVITSADDADKQATDALNGLFTTLVGSGNVVLPYLNLNQTVGSLLDALKNADTTLATLDLGEATAKNVGDATKFVAESTNTGGALQVLPNVFGLAKNAPLLKVSLGASSASVTYDKVKQGLAGTTDNTIVYVESPLLPVLKLGQVGVAGVLPFKTLTDTLGYDSGTAADGSPFVAVKPGQSLSLFCDPGQPTALCTTITVGAVEKPVPLPDGGILEKSSSVSIHALQNISDLVPGAGTILANDALDTVLGSATTKTTTGGIVFEVAGSVAQVSPALLAGTDSACVANCKPPADLPRTGANPWLAVLGVMTLLGFVVLRRTVHAAR